MGWPKGRKRSAEEKRKISDGLLRLYSSDRRPVLDRRGEKNPAWRYPVGSTWLDHDGYALMKIAEGEIVGMHRYAMEQHIGRKLRRGEFVHHIDGNRQNNELGNLRLTTLAEHNSFHHKGKVPWNLGRPHPPETRKKISDAARGRPSSFLGRRHTEEAKKRMAEAHRGKISPLRGRKMSDETRRKISEAAKGRIPHNKGKHWTDEQRKHISEGIRRAFAEKKRSSPWG